MSEILAYMMAVGLHTVYKGPSGDGRSDVSDRPHSLANLRRSHGVAISNTSPTSSCKCPCLIHSALRNIGRIPAGSYLSNSSEKTCMTKTAHGLHNHQRQKASGVQLHGNHSSTCAVRSPIAHEIPSSRMFTHPPGPRNRRSRLFRRLERGGSPESPGHDPGHDYPETGRQKAR